MKVHLNFDDSVQMANIATTKAAEMQQLASALETTAAVDGKVGPHDRMLIELANAQALILLELASIQRQRARLVQGDFPRGLVVPRNGG